MNDLKSDLFPRLGCLRGDVARQGEEPGWRGRVHLGGGWGGAAPLVFGKKSGERLGAALLLTHQTWVVYFIHERE